MKYRAGMKRYSKKLAMLLLLVFGVNVLATASNTTPASGGCFAHVDEVAEEKGINQFYAAYLKNRIGYERKEEQARQSWRSKQSESHPEIPPVWEIECTKLLMRYFEQNQAAVKVENCAYFSPNVYTDLNIFPDPEQPDKVTVFSDIANLGVTEVLSKLGLLEMLSKPSSDLSKLRQRQRLIEFLYKNNAVFGQLDAALKRFAGAEKSLLYFLKVKDDGNNPDSFKRYFNQNVNKATIGWYASLFTRFLPAGATGTLAIAAYLAATLHLNNYDAERGYIGGSFTGGFGNVASGSHNIGANNSPNCMLPYLGNPLADLAYGPVLLAAGFGLSYLTYRLYNGVFTPKCEMGKRFQSCMMDMTKIFEATKEIGTIVAKNEAIAAEVSGYQEALKFISKDEDNDIKDLLVLFENSSFKGEPTALGPKGKVFKAFGQMCERADKFVELMRFVSRIDALMAVVKALRSTSKSEVRYSIPEFVKADAGKPYMKINKFWHPTLNPKNAITNDIELGKDFRSVIVTGANAGGKSTWMQSLALIAILAQTFGIVPAESAELTPFTKVIVDVRVKDEIGQKSTFQAEIEKLTNAMRQIKDLPNDKFALYVVDEPLKGSNAQDCAKIGRGVIEDLGSSPNALLVVATHHPEFAEIAGINTFFRNYRVHSILYSADVKDPVTGSVKKDYAWKHTYKVVPGVEEHRFALAIMKDALEKSKLDFSASKYLLE